MSYKAFFIVSLIVAGSIFAFIFGIKMSSASTSLQTMPCRKPLTYQFGRIDPRFDINMKELAAIMQKVDKLWATAMNKVLLTYRKKGRVTINLVYSEHQQKTEDAKQFYKRIQIKKEQRKINEKQYQRLKKNYLDQRNELEQRLSKYEQLIADYKTLISKWNKKDRIPTNEKQKLKNKQQSIKTQKHKLDHQREIEESMRKRANHKSDRLNALVKEENGLIKAYNKKYGKSKMFNQGKYTKADGQESINIYQFANDAELKTVLAHEAGHALGLHHVRNSSSIMFKMMGEQDIFNLKLSKEDVAAIKDRCNQ